MANALPSSVGTASAAAAAGPSLGQTAEVNFITGTSPLKFTNAVNFWTWARDNPATYTGTNSAHKWQGGAVGSSGGTVSYFFDPNSNWTPAEQAGWEGSLALWSAVANVKFVQTTDMAAANVILYRGSDGAAFENDVYTPSSRSASPSAKPRALSFQSTPQRSVVRTIS